MKDLDFDELDRAVSTLMNDVSKNDLSKNDEDIKTLSIDPSIPDSDTTAPVADATPAPVAAPAVEVTQPKTTPPAARRGGRFMDVVHHSSDMKKDQANTRPQPVSRQGTTIEPVKNTSSDVGSTAKAEPETPAVKNDEVPSTSTTSSTDWPDPLDMATSLPTESEHSKPVVEQPDPMPLLEEGSETAVTAPASEDLQPLTSPFLSDAKVEKRPLGAGQPLQPTEEAAEPDHTPVISNADAELTTDNPSDQLPPSLEEPKKDLPPELQGDLVAIESGSAVDDAKTEQAPSVPVAKEAESQPEAKSNAPHPAALLEATTEDEPAFSGPTSIAQQYKEEPSTGDSKNGAIYDTDTYHKPLAHPAQKKSGWLWVIWILLILLVGAGAGAALYFLRII